VIYEQITYTSIYITANVEKMSKINHKRWLIAMVPLYGVEG
jgi:hypothetical protein